MTNIKTVSELAGVSVATVSRTFQFPEKVAPSTREKVLAAAERARYRPDGLARNFRTRRSNAIMVMVPNISNPFFSEVLRAMQETAFDRGYSVLLGDTQGDPERERTYLDFLGTRQADGVIQLGAHVPTTLPFPRTDDENVAAPFVHVCEAPTPSPFPSVRINNEAAAFAVTQHLIAMGRHRIAAVLGPKNSPLTADRLAGWKRALEELGAGSDDSLIYEGDFTLQAGQDAVARILAAAEHPDAIFFFNDEMAIGGLQGLKEAGIAVPDDMAVAGFDDIAFARFTEPALTTVRQPKKQIGEAAMTMLIDLIEDKNTPPQNTVLDASLVIRTSTGQAGKP